MVKLVALVNCGEITAGQVHTPPLSTAAFSSGPRLGKGTTLTCVLGHHEWTVPHKHLITEAM